jgi:gluconokinase
MRTREMALILFGVSGAGKTSVGQLLAQRLGWKFLDGDDFHSQPNLDLMKKGIPLEDEQRWPWLKTLRELIRQQFSAKNHIILACSALKKSYRDYLKVEERVLFVYLRGSYDLIADRIRQRSGHFMPEALLQSQFAALEEPELTENVITIEIEKPPRDLVDEIISRLSLETVD